jgi:hypothetical protein
MVELYPAELEHVVKFSQLFLGTPEGITGDLSGDPAFLLGDFGGITERVVQPISSKQRLFVPVNTVVITETEAYPDINLEAIANADMSTASQADLEIDGKMESVLDQKFRVATQRFPFGPPKNYEAVADGYYVLIGPLPPGDHKIVTEATVDIPYKEPPPWRSRTTYMFRVQ